jgi:hypothetical protein
MDPIIINAILKPKEGCQGLLLSELKKVQNESKKNLGVWSTFYINLLKMILSFYMRYGKIVRH